MSDLECLAYYMGKNYALGIGDTCVGDCTDYPTSRNETDFPWDRFIREVLRHSSIDFQAAFDLGYNNYTRKSKATH